MPGIVRKWQNLVNLKPQRSDRYHRTRRNFQYHQWQLLFAMIHNKGVVVLADSTHTSGAMEFIYWLPDILHRFPKNDSYIIFPYTHNLGDFYSRKHVLVLGFSTYWNAIISVSFSKNAHICSLFSWVVSNYVAQSTTSWVPHFYC